MYNNLRKCLKNSSSVIIQRYLSSTEISTALRPFYFAVHPDLFGRHPNERAINENSLKQLSSFIESAQTQRRTNPCTLQFYLRLTKGDENFRLVKINLQDRNLRNTILHILKTCNISTDYIDNIPSTAETKFKSADIFTRYEQTYKEQWSNDYDMSNIHKVKVKVDTKAKEELTLKKWLEINFNSALEKLDANKPIRKEVESMCREIYRVVGVKEIRWDCGWNVMHFRGCLQSFIALLNNHPDSVDVLKDRIIVFSPYTGINLDGHVMLNSGEVWNNWLDFLKNVRKHDKALLKIPSFEKALSQVLREIKVVRRKFMPKIVAGEYEKHLLRLITNVSDYCSFRKFPENWPTSLEKYQIVVETEAGPLMVSPTGQFIVPSSCPGFLLVNFITDNLDNAAKKTLDYNTHKHTEKFLHTLCVKEFNLAGLSKDDNVTPDLMIKCCETLLSNKNELAILDKLYLNISTYYSVLSDGVVCIPWNFKI